MVQSLLALVFQRIDSMLPDSAFSNQVLAMLSSSLLLMKLSALVVLVVGHRFLTVGRVVVESTCSQSVADVWIHMLFCWGMQVRQVCMESILAVFERSPTLLAAVSVWTAPLPPGSLIHNTGDDCACDRFQFRPIAQLPH